MAHIYRRYLFHLDTYLKVSYDFLISFCFRTLKWTRVRDKICIFICFIRTTNLEAGQNNLEKAELCLFLKLLIVLYFLKNDLKSLWVKSFQKGHLLMCSIYLCRTKYILYTAYVLDFESVVKLFKYHFTGFGRHVLNKYFNFVWKKIGEMNKGRVLKCFQCTVVFSEFSLLEFQIVFL